MFGLSPLAEVVHQLESRMRKKSHEANRKFDRSLLRTYDGEGEGRFSSLAQMMEFA